MGLTLRCLGYLLIGWVEVELAPHKLQERFAVHAQLFGNRGNEVLEVECPAVIGRSKRYVAFFWLEQVDLLSSFHLFVESLATGKAGHFKELGFD